MNQSLKQSIEEALSAYRRLQDSKAQITVTVDDGRVTLSGYTASESTKGMATFLAGNTEGVTEVKNELLSDPQLERAVARALAADSRTRPLTIRVQSELGHVALRGSAPDEETIETVLEVARAVEGIKQVVSALSVERPAQITA